ETARTSGRSWSTVTGIVVAFPNTLFDAESPMNKTSMPASSKISAEYMSYGVTMVIFWPPCSFSRRCRTRTHLAGVPPPPHLLHQQTVLDEVASAVADILTASEGVGGVRVVGAPGGRGRGLYDCAGVGGGGRLVGGGPRGMRRGGREFGEAGHGGSGEDQRG